MFIWIWRVNYKKTGVVSQISTDDGIYLRVKLFVCPLSSPSICLCICLSLPVYFACALHLSVSVVLSLSTILMSASIYTYIQIYVLLSIYLDIRLRMHTGFHVHIHLCSIILTCNKILSIYIFTYSVYRKIVFFTNSLQSIPCNSHFPSIGLVGNYRATHLRKRSDLYSHYYFLYNQ